MRYFFSHVDFPLYSDRMSFLLFFKKKFCSNKNMLLKHLALFCFLELCFLYSFSLMSQNHNAQKISFMTYNIHGLPLPTGIDHSRYKKIGKLLYQQRLHKKAPSIVLLQEAFHPKTKALIQEAKYPFVAYGPYGKHYQSKTGLFSSGLVILSAFPILWKKTLIFKKCISFDCFVSKGLLLVKIARTKKKFFYVLNTHLNADPDDPLFKKKDARKIRLSQLKQAYLWLKKFSFLKKAPFFFGGDFNFQTQDPEWNVFQKLFTLNDATSSCLYPFCERQPIVPTRPWHQWIDHLFFNLNYRKYLLKVKARFQTPSTHLSDHPALKVSVFFP